MKIAIATDEDMVSAHFGRCRCYTIVDIVNGKVTAKSRVDTPPHQPGMLPSFLGEMGVEIVVAGGMGMRAKAAFTMKNIQTIVGVTGTVDGVIERILNGTLEGGQSLCDKGGGSGKGHGSGCHHGADSD